METDDPRSWPGRERRDLKEIELGCRSGWDHCRGSAVLVGKRQRAASKIPLSVDQQNYYEPTSRGRFGTQVSTHY
jgi:hypothetical protein